MNNSRVIMGRPPLNNADLWVGEVCQKNAAIEHHMMSNPNGCVKLRFQKMLIRVIRMATTPTIPKDCPSPEPKATSQPNGKASHSFPLTITIKKKKS